MKHILVTGGSGFIGTNFIRYILENGEEVSAVVNLDLVEQSADTEALENIQRDSRYHFVCGDIRDKQLLDEVFERFDINTIVNLAETSTAARDDTSPNQFTSVNVDGTYALLEAARECWGYYPKDYFSCSRRKDAHFLQVSPVEACLMQSNSECVESPRLQSMHEAYVSSKANAERVVLSYYMNYGMPVSILRCSNVYGPYQSPENGISRMILNLSASKESSLENGETDVKDWLYVEDCCTALAAVLDDKEPGEIYNAVGHSAADQWIMHLIRKELGLQDAKRLSETEALCWLYRQNTRWKITDELGWEPEYTLEEGISETVNWYLKNSRWAAPVLAYRKQHPNHRRNSKGQLRHSWNREFLGPELISLSRILATADHTLYIRPDKSEEDSGDEKKQTT